MILSAGAEIHLDTSFLVRALIPGSEEGTTLLRWLGARRVIAMSTLAWGEFLCGPVEKRDRDAASRVIPRHVPVGTEEAAAAADLFNETGRRRGSFTDCIVAATAITSGALLATTDRTHFRRFTESGLELAE